ncbi:MAG: hypothetical protein ACXAC7_10385 [Candidatus Hodarchaeales archaeon]|jgi:hypothetical protein
MSGAKNNHPEIEAIMDQNRGFQFKTSLEIFLIYVAGFITFLLIFSSLNIVTFTVLGYSALFMFMTICIFAICYCFYNIAEIINALASKFEF